MGSGRASLGEYHRGKAWKPFQGFHFNRVGSGRASLGAYQRGKVWKPSQGFQINGPSLSRIVLVAFGSDTSVNYCDKAEALFLRGYNCAQATAAAFAEDLGLETSLVLRSTAGFGGGTGGLRETCGAVSAMAYLAGLHAGAHAPEDLVTKTALYDLVKKMVREFTALHGTTCCRDLLEKAGCLPLPNPSERDAKYYALRPCARIVASAAEISSRTLLPPR